MQWPGSSYWRDAGGTATGNINTTGSDTSLSRSSISMPFTFGYKTIVLPLKIISLAAERRSGTSLLHWVTVNDENVDHFDVQRSYTATGFTTIGNVAARNIIFQQEYNFEDHAALNGIAYYRLRIVDRDGKISYSKIVAVTKRQIQSSGFVILNPTRNAITIFNKTGTDGLFDYKLLNAGGQQVLNGKVDMSINGNAVLPLPPQTAAGVYLLELSNQKIEFRQKVLVEK